MNGSFNRAGHVLAPKNVLEGDRYLYTLLSNFFLTRRNGSPFFRVKRMLTFFPVRDNPDLPRRCLDSSIQCDVGSRTY